MFWQGICDSENVWFSERPEPERIRLFWTVSETHRHICPCIGFSEHEPDISPLSKRTGCMGHIQPNPEFCAIAPMFPHNPDTFTNLSDILALAGEKRKGLE